MSRSRVTAKEAEHFYRVGALGLRALQDLGFSAERFGPESLARWKGFCGELTETHRLDLLLRDGAVMFPRAFSARSVFALQGLALDEPFGPEWKSLAPSQAASVLREAQQAERTEPASLHQRLRTWADAWGLSLGDFDPALLTAVKGASRLVVAGAGAVVALAAHMADRSDCDFGDQVLVVTEQAGIRQLAGLAAALTGSRTAPRVALPDASETVGFARATGVLVSSDAPPREADAARSMAAALGA
jgi:hypothetical protein